MSINRDQYIKNFHDENGHAWACPTCKKGVLNAEPATLKSIETSDSVEWSQNKHGNWEPEHTIERFCCRFVCSYSKCLESVFCSGNTSYEEVYGYDPVTGDESRELVASYDAKYFNPALIILNATEGTPIEIVTALEDSFELFFVSSDSAGNKVRLAVEYLMDELDASKAAPPAFTPLGQRINNIPVPHDTEKEKLKAIKWLGNTGSHGDVLTKNDILDAYDILDSVLEKIYGTSAAHVASITTQINTNQGPR